MGVVALEDAGGAAQPVALGEVDPHLLAALPGAREEREDAAGAVAGVVVDQRPTLQQVSGLRVEHDHRRRLGRHHDGLPGRVGGRAGHEQAGGHAVGAEVAAVRGAAGAVARLGQGGAGGRQLLRGPHLRHGGLGRHGGAAHGQEVTAPVDGGGQPVAEDLLTADLLGEVEMVRAGDVAVAAVQMERVQVGPDQAERCEVVPHVAERDVHRGPVAGAGEEAVETGLHPHRVGVAVDVGHGLVRRGQLERSGLGLLRDLVRGAQGVRLHLRTAGSYVVVAARVVRGGGARRPCRRRSVPRGVRRGAGETGHRECGDRGDGDGGPATAGRETMTHGAPPGQAVRVTARSLFLSTARRASALRISSGHDPGGASVVPTTLRISSIASQSLACMPATTRSPRSHQARNTRPGTSPVSRTRS